MNTYTTRRNLYGSLTNDSSTTNLTLGDTLMMDAERTIVGNRPWTFLETTASISTVAQQQFYSLPNNAQKVTSSPSVLIGTTRYTPKLAPSREFWDQLNYSSNVYSDYPEWYFIFNKQIGFWPLPSSSNSNAITLPYRRRPIDLNKADYTTGTITTLAANGTAVTGSGTTWTAGMVGSFLQITAGNGANIGDGQWYEITAVGSTTTLTIGRAYQGTAISAGSAAFTIGQVSTLPEDFDIMPVYKATETYFTSIQPMKDQAALYKRLYDEKYQLLKETYSSKTDDPTIEDGRTRMINPNLMVSL